MYNTIEVYTSGKPKQSVGSDEAIQVVVGEELPIAFLGHGYICPGLVEVNVALTFAEAFRFSHFFKCAKLKEETPI